jgi:predicted metal-dependent hydrolase
VTHEPLYLRGIEHFNRGEFFEAHDVWEELWREMKGDDGRTFYHGLINAAVALHHYRNGNLEGARRQWAYCAEHLERFRPRHLDLDVDGFLGAMWGIFERIYEKEPPPWDPSLAPPIRLRSEL